MDYNKQLAIYTRKEIDGDTKIYRTVGLATFVVACALCVLRILFGYAIVLPESLDWVSDLLFSVSYQVCVLFLFTFLFYKLRLKMTAREVFDFCSVRKVKWYYVALCVPLGLCVYLVTILVSSTWGTFLEALGYTYPQSTPLPERFSAWRMILDLLITAVLPAFCEEFFMRGSFLTAVRKSNSLLTSVIIAGVAFGLFHQNVTQVLYTTLFGALMAFLTLKTKSILPAITVHFVNNALAVFSDYCNTYGFMRGGLTSLLNWGFTYYPVVAILGILFTASAGAGLVFLMVRLLDNKRLGKKKDVILDSGFDNTNKRVVIVGDLDKQEMIDLGLDKEVYGEKQKEDLFKPTLRDNVFVIGAIALTITATFSTFIFGLLV